jgi:hypothetical protein
LNLPHPNQSASTAPCIISAAIVATKRAAPGDRSRLRLLEVDAGVFAAQKDVAAAYLRKAMAYQAKISAAQNLINIREIRDAGTFDPDRV